MHRKERLQSTSSHLRFAGLFRGSRQVPVHRPSGRLAQIHRIYCSDRRDGLRSLVVMGMYLHTYLYVREHVYTQELFRPAWM